MKNKEIILKMEKITKIFSRVKALENIDFDLEKGEIHGLVGENGAGKSTLMHILAGVHKIDGGSIYLEGKKIRIKNPQDAKNIGISIIFQERSLLTNLSVAENIFVENVPRNKLGMIKWNKLYSETEKILSRLDLKISPQKHIGEISAAQQQMVEIAKGISRNCRILILDEPTSAITVDECELLFRVIKKLKSQGVSIVYISHRLKEIKQIADRVTILKDGNKVGTYSVSNISIDGMISKMVGRQIKEYKAAGSVKSSNTVLKLSNFSGRGFKNINLELREGEILVLAGLTGAGRTELAKAIFGANKIFSGEIWLYGKKIKIRSVKEAMKNRIGYLPEDRKELGLFLNMTLYENIEAPNIRNFSKGIFTDNKAKLDTSEEYRRKLDISTPNISQIVKYLSGGNQQKVSIAKWLIFKPKILIVDEPTKGIDVGAKAAVYEILNKLAKDENLSIIIISSEILEILSIGNRIIVMYEGQKMGELSHRDVNEELIMQLASGLKKKGA